MKVRSIESPEEEKAGKKRYVFFCPGCKCGHAFRTPDWQFNGDLEHPTILPSILHTGGPETPVCHVYVRDGMVQFLPDCGHALKGQTVPLEDF